MTNPPEPLGMVTPRDEDECIPSEEEPVVEAMTGNGQTQDTPSMPVDVLAAKVGDLTDWMGRFYALVDERVGTLPHIDETVTALAAGDQNSEIARRLDDLIEAVAETATGIDVRLNEVAEANPSGNPSFDLRELHTAVADIRSAVESVSAVRAVDAETIASLREELISHLEGFAAPAASAHQDPNGVGMEAIRSDIERILTERLDHTPPPAASDVAEAVEAQLSNRLNALAEIVDGVAVLLERADGVSTPDVAARLDSIAAAATEAGNVQASVDDLAVAVGEAITGIHDRLARLDTLDNRLTAVLDAGDDPQTVELFEHVADIRGRLDEIAVGLGRSVNEIGGKIEESSAAPEMARIANTVDDFVVAVGETITGIQDRLERSLDERDGLAEIATAINDRVQDQGRELIAAISKVETQVTSLTAAAADQQNSTDVAEVFAPFAEQLGEVLAAVKADPANDIDRQITSDTVDELVVAVGESLQGIHSRLDQLPAGEEHTALAEAVTELRVHMDSDDMRDHLLLSLEAFSSAVESVRSHMDRSVDSIADRVNEGLADVVSSGFGRVSMRLDQSDEAVTEVLNEILGRINDDTGSEGLLDLLASSDFASRLDQLSTAVQAGNAGSDRAAVALDRVAAEVSSLREAASGIVGRSPDAGELEETILAEIRSIAAQVETLDRNGSGDTAEQLRALLSAVDGLAQRSTDTGAIADRLARIETLVHELDASDAVETVGTALNRVAEVIGETARRSDVSALSNKINALQAERADSTESERVTTIESTIAEHLRSYFALTEAVGDRLDELTEAVGNIPSADLDMSPLMERLTALSLNVGSPGEVRSRLDAIERALVSLNEFSTEEADVARRTDIDRVDERLAAVADLVKQTPAPETGIGERVDAVSGQVSELASVLADAIGAMRPSSTEEQKPTWVLDLESSLVQVMERLDRAAEKADSRSDLVADAVSELKTMSAHSDDTLVQSLIADLSDRSKADLARLERHNQEWFGALGEAVEALANAKGDPSVVISRLDSLSTQIDGLAGKENAAVDIPLVIADIKAVVERTASKVGSVDTRLASFDLPELREHIETRFASVEARIDARHTDTADLIAELNGAVVAARGQIGAVIDGQADAAESVSLGNETMGSVRNVVTDIQRALAACRAEWNDAHTLLSTKLDTAAVSADDGLTRTDAVAERVDDLARTTQQRLDGWASTVKSLEGTMLTVSESLSGPDAIKEHLDEQRVALGGVASELRQVRGQFTPEALTASFADDVRSVIGDASQEIASLVEKLDARSGDVAALASRVEDRIDEMEQRVAAAVVDVTESVANWGEQVAGEVQQSVAALENVTRQADEVRGLRDQVALTLDGVNEVAASLGGLAVRADTKTIRSEVSNMARTLATLSRSVGSLDQTLVEVRTEIAAGQVAPSGDESKALDERVSDLASAVEEGLGEVSRRMGTLARSLPSQATSEAAENGGRRGVLVRHRPDRSRPLRADD